MQLPLLYQCLSQLHYTFVVLALYWYLSHQLLIGRTTYSEHQNLSEHHIDRYLQLEYSLWLVSSWFHRRYLDLRIDVDLKANETLNQYLLPITNLLYSVERKTLQPLRKYLKKIHSMPLIRLHRSN